MTSKLTFGLINVCNLIHGSGRFVYLTERPWKVINEVGSNEALLSKVGGREIASKTIDISGKEGCLKG